MTPTALFPIARTVLFATGDAAVAVERGVCVAVSLYDYAEYIAECLDSVAAQTHRAIELVVVDDASRDGSADVARDWLAANAGRFARTCLVRHDENQGLSQARNTAFALARAPFVLVLDADNALYPRAAARLLESLEDAPETCGAAYSQTVMFGAEVEPGYADLWDPARLAPANYVDAMALVRRSAWGRLGGYAHLDLGWEDYDFWCRFVEHGLSAVYVPELLCRYRVHAKSMLRTSTDLHNGRVVEQMMARHPWLRLGS